MVNISNNIACKIRDKQGHITEDEVKKDEDHVQTMFKE